MKTVLTALLAISCITAFAQTRVSFEAAAYEALQESKASTDSGFYTKSQLNRDLDYILMVKPQPRMKTYTSEAFRCDHKRSYSDCSFNIKVMHERENVDSTIHVRFRLHSHPVKGMEVKNKILVSVAG